MVEKSGHHIFFRDPEATKLVLKIPSIYCAIGARSWKEMMICTSAKTEFDSGRILDQKLVYPDSASYVYSI